NAGISVWTLNNLYEYALFTGSESLFANDSTNPTPENGNGIPNILDETKFEMDFLNEMVVKDGEYKDMVYHKIHDYTWTGLALRPAEAGLVRIVKPPSTAATLNYVATAAQQSRLMSDFDTSYSDTLLAQAKASYEAAKKYPDLLAPMNQATGGGAYGDTDVSDEFYWAACELYSTTGEEIYLTDLKSYEKALTTVTNLSGGENTGSFSSFNWGNVASLGNLTLCLNEDKKAVLSKADSETLQQSIIAAADAYIDTEKKQGYSLPYKGTTFTDENNAPGQTFTGYEWGSNSFVLNNAVVLGYAYNLTHSGGYLNGVVNALNYILGMNGMDISYVTRYGSFYAENPHHRYWSFSLDPSFPKAPEGVLVGGPNSSMTDPMIQSLEIPLDSPPQICYVDNIEAWSVNECTINWNSPLAWVTGFLNISVPVYDATVTPLEVAPVETAPVESTDTGSKIPLPIILSVIGVIVVIFGGMIITNLKKRPKKED
ncbi:MAG: glycoside hydrolase family 9 protein, partial [Oscillospiraceae bacterium]|nr:glycoside hydrolase family 9 protein [Oscillospiraceae bacterium]